MNVLNANKQADQYSAVSSGQKPYDLRVYCVLGYSDFAKTWYQVDVAHPERDTFLGVDS